MASSPVLLPAATHEPGIRSQTHAGNSQNGRHLAALPSIADKCPGKHSASDAVALKRSEMTGKSSKA
jgi:hypothetical protein